MPTQPRPNFTIQAASLWASGDSSTFSGSGGPAGFDPFGGFGDIVSSSGLLDEPFADSVLAVDAGDQVTFVLAVQNLSTVPGYDLKLRDTVPVGFALPDDGEDVEVTDGAGNALAYTGDLFDPNGGLVLTDPVAAYDPDSGANVVLVTFTLVGSASIQVPLANVTDFAQIISYAGAPGGPNLSGGANPASLSATTAVQTSGLTVSSVADQPPGSLPPGHTASFDVTVSLPEGITRDLRLDEILPQSGTSWLQLVSASIVRVGAHLTASAPLIVQPDNSIALGNVTDTPDNLQTADDQLVVRVTVQGAGTTAGTGQITTVVSAADPNSANGRWSSTLTNTLSLDRPDVPPTISGISANQNATNTMQVLPFASLLLADPDTNQTETLTVHLSNPALGALGGSAPLTTNASGDIVISGAVAAVQAAARSLLFQPASGATGTEIFTLTLDDGFGGVVVNGGTALTVSAAADTSDLAHYSPSPTQTILTSTATGTSTVSPVEAYAGPIDSVQSQFIYDGTAPLAMVAQQSGMLIRSEGDATAVQLLDGANVLDIRRGSGFMISGAGADTFLFDARQTQPSWDTIAGFHTGDAATIWGFTQGVSREWWDANAGAVGYQGATLRLDLDNNGTIDASLTFAGKSLSDVSHYSLGSGIVSGTSYLTVLAT